ncbi:MAG: hypothetical protein ONB05_06990, partial [candidate division KSB1 bacterium]|nr:hypothetical protein [candidate division KSB1 bacterium]
MASFFLQKSFCLGAGIVPPMVRRLSAGLAVCSVLLQACGSDTPQPSTAAQRPAPALQPSPPARV